MIMKDSLRCKLYSVIFEADTPAGKYFDISLLVIIFFSIIAVMLESVKSFDTHYHFELKVIEWIITLIFTTEYLLRIIIVRKPFAYIFSFFGIIDFLSVIPTYIGLLVSGAHGLIIIRALRLLRVFRIFKLSRYLNASKVIVTALKASRTKISVFLYAVVMVVIIIGTIMYFVEGEASGFTSIPMSIYWAIVTLTTVGYGDIAPITTLGRFIAGFVMILGYAIIAVPTGIVSAEIYAVQKTEAARVCGNCMKEGHEPDAKYCKFCGHSLDED